MSELVSSLSCTRCGSKLVIGKSIRNTLTGIGDFHDEDQVCTVSPGGSGEYIDCLKCSSQSCGRQFELQDKQVDGEGEEL